MANMHIKRLQAQYRFAIKAPHEHLMFYMDETKINVWYIMIHNVAGDNDEFMGGEYLVRIELPEDFPFKPPHFYFLTPQGVYDINKKICISIGEFHKDDYLSTLGVLGFCAQLVSGLIGWKSLGHGIALINTSIAAKRTMASESRAYNETHHASILARIHGAFESYSAKWPTEPPKKAPMEDDKNTPH